MDVSIIGGADGPTAIYVCSLYRWELLAGLAVIAAAVIAAVLLIRKKRKKNP